jgi:Transposase
LRGRGRGRGHGPRPLIRLRVQAYDTARGAAKAACGADARAESVAVAPRWGLCSAHLIEQRTDKSLKGMRWSLLKDRAKLRPEAAADLDALIARMTTVRTARAWVYKEQLRDILERRQINVVRAMLLRCGDAAHLVHGRIGMPDDVELVEGDASVGQLLGAALGERRRHVNADGLDLLGRATVLVQFASNGLDGLGLASLGNGEHAPLDGVGRQRDVVMASSARGFVDRQGPDVAEVRLLQRQCDMAPTDRQIAITLWGEIPTVRATAAKGICGTRNGHFSWEASYKDEAIIDCYLQAERDEQ